MSFSSIREMLQACQESRQPLYEVILESDLAESGLTRAESEAEMHRLWSVMRATSDGYCGADRSMSGFVVGATAKTVEQAQKAYREGADYLGTGAIFPTTTKVKTVLTPVSRLNDVCRSVPIPVVAIGGLNAGNMDVLNGSPIDGIAVVSAIMKSADPEAAARELFSRVRVIKENNR